MARGGRPNICQKFVVKRRFMTFYDALYHFMTFHDSWCPIEKLNKASKLSQNTVQCRKMLHNVVQSCKVLQTISSHDRKNLF